MAVYIAGVQFYEGSAERFFGLATGMGGYC